MEKQAVVLGDGTDADVVAFAEDQLEAAVQVFHVRGGRVRGQRGWVVEQGRGRHHRRPRRAPPPAGLRRRAAGDAAVPREVLVPALPPDADAPSHDWLAALRGSRVTCGCRSAATSGR